MAEDDHLKNTSPEGYHSPAFLLISIGALFGAAVSVILLHSNRIILAFRQRRLQSQPELAAASSEYEPSSLEAALPSATQPGFAPGNPPVTSVSRVPEPAISSKSGTPAGKGAHQVEGSAGKQWSAPTRYIMGVFLFLAGLFVLYIGRSAISMVIVAALLALFVNPLIQYLRRRFRMKIGLAVGITYFFVVAVMLLVPLLLIPSLVNAVNFVLNIDTKLMAAQINQIGESISTALQALPGLAAILKPFLDSVTTILNNLASPTQPGASGITLSAAELTSQFGKALGIAAGVLGPTFSALASIVFTFLMSLQMTLTADEMKNWYADLIPPSFGPELSALMMNIQRIWIGFLRGQMSLMVIIGLFTWLGATILGLPQALLLGVIAGVLELIPNVGPTLAAIPAVILALFFGSTHLLINNLVFALLVVGFYVLVQMVENQFIVPRIMGDAVDLPSLVVLIGTIAGAGAFGILGALLATPFIATGNLLFRYVYRKIMEDLPTAPTLEEKPGLLDTMKGFISRLRRPFSKDKPPALSDGRVQPAQEKE